MRGVGGVLQVYVCMFFKVIIGYILDCLLLVNLSIR